MSKADLKLLCKNSIQEVFGFSPPMSNILILDKKMDTFHHKISCSCFENLYLVERVAGTVFLTITWKNGVPSQRFKIESLSVKRGD